jgi:hypothetical protein
MMSNKVIAGIANVAGKLAREGISKDRKNDQQGFRFRGIDDVYNALAAPLAEAGLVCVPRVLERSCVERVNAKGTALFYETVKIEYTVWCAEDGSFVQGIGIGQAMDSGDKALNKAQSAAYKYFWFQLLCIPTEGDNDADKTTHADIAPKVPDGAETAWISMEASTDYAQFKAAWEAASQEARQWIIKGKQKELADLRAKLAPAA